MLKDGSQRSASFSGSGSWPIDSLYPYNIGPDLRGLFFQSDFAVVTKMQLKLQRKPESYASVQFGIRSTEELIELVPVLQQMMEEGILSGIPHIANRKRIEENVLPYLKSQFSGNSNWAKKYEALFRKLTFAGEWQGIAFVAGHKEDVKWRKREIKRRLSGRTSVRVYSDSFLKIMDFLTALLPKNLLLEMFKSLRPLMRYNLGVPSDLAMSAFGLRPGSEGAEEVKAQVDASEGTFEYYLPIGPFDRKSVEEMLHILHDYDTELAVTVNAISSCLLELVISKYAFGEVKRLHLPELERRFAEKGYFSYRPAKHSNHRADAMLLARKRLAELLDQ